MDLTLSVDDEVVRLARLQAQARGTTLDQLISDCLESFARTTDPRDNTAEFEELFGKPHGNSGGWKFNREEIYERR